MLQLQVIDYQAIEKALLKIEGLTIIKGESNSGKSSIFKALYDATHNRFRNGCVRFGQDSAVVTLKYGDRDDVLRIERSTLGGSPIMRLGTKATGYKRFDKLNREVPKEVLDYNNFGRVDLTVDKYVSLNFFPQFTPPLLLQFSPRRIVDMLSYSKASQDSIEVKKSLSDKNLELRGTFSAYDSVLGNAKLELNKARLVFKSFSAAEEVSKINNIYTSALEKQETLKEAKVCLAELEEYNAKKSKIDAMAPLLEICNDSIMQDDFLKGVLNDMEELLVVTRKEVAVSNIRVEIGNILAAAEVCDSLSETLESLNQVQLINNKGRIAHSILLETKKLTRLDHLKTTHSDMMELDKVTEALNVLNKNKEEGICPYCSSKIPGHGH